MGIKREILQLIKETDFHDKEQTFFYAETVLEAIKKITVFTHKIKQEKIHFTRARIHKNSGKQFKNISELWYPSPENVNLGRCNFSSKPVFYCSNDKATTVFEISPKPNDVFSLLDVKINKPEIELIYLGENTKRTPNFNNINKHDQEINELLEILFRENVADKAQYHYHKTAIFANAFLNYADGIAYPSVGSNCKGWNIVFPTSFIDNHVSFLQATTHRVLEWENENKYKIECLSKSIKLDSKKDFIWERIESCETHSFDENIYH